MYVRFIQMYVNFICKCLILHISNANVYACASAFEIAISNVQYVRLAHFLVNLDPGFTVHLHHYYTHTHARTLSLTHMHKYLHACMDIHIHTRAPCISFGPFSLRFDRVFNVAECFRTHQRPEISEDTQTHRHRH